MNRIKTTLFLCLIALTFSTQARGQSLPSPDADPIWQTKIERAVQEKSRLGTVEMIVLLGEQADVSGARHLESKRDKGHFVTRTLTETAARTQESLLQWLREKGVEHRSYWIANMIWVRGSADLPESLAKRPEVARIRANPAVRLDVFKPAAQRDRNEAAGGIEWNIAHINAPAVWAEGITGQGVVIAGQDTGYQWNHPALKRRYRGWSATGVSHDYNWHDAIHSGSTPCGVDAPAPCDDDSHGTHTMGTMVGDDGQGNRIGVAPGARWIGCRNMANGYGTPITYAECYQWFMAPTRLDGSDPDPSRAPHVINNSWGCPPSEGCTDPEILLTVVDNVRAAGILTVQSAGNEGPGCSTVKEPAALYDASFSVGATDAGDEAASFSSRGPVTRDGSGRLKPDIAAPGVDIRSSVPGNRYEPGWSGTSMAGPHVAGMAALLMAANPELSNQVDALEEVIRHSAVPLTTAEGCGGDTPSDVPNNVYGWGRIDALAAVEAAGTVGTLKVTLAPAEAVAAGAQWRVDQGDWHDGGETVPVLPGTSHVVEFNTIPGWTTPDRETVAVERGQMTDLSAEYALSLPVVAIQAVEPSTVEGGSGAGRFRISRKTASPEPLEVHYGISGSAVNGKDYKLISGVIVIREGRTSAFVRIFPKDDTLSEGEETVVLNILPNAAYERGGRRRDTVVIFDNDR